jgi:LPXTG-motif cell wall-anchored protein
MHMTRQSRRRSSVIAGAGMAALIGSAVLAAPASAHNSDWSVDCSSVTVHLAAYNGSVTNAVTLSVDGGTVLAHEDSFGAAYDFTGALPDHTTAIKVHLVVTAGDNQRFNKDEFKVSAPCEKPSSPPPPPSSSPGKRPTTPVSPTTSAPAPASTPATTATSNAPVVQASTSPAAGDLAETGSSSSTPMIAGIAAAVVAAGAGLLFLNRRRGTHR